MCTHFITESFLNAMNMAQFSVVLDMVYDFPFYRICINVIIFSKVNYGKQKIVIIVKNVMDTKYKLNIGPPEPDVGRGYLQRTSLSQGSNFGR